MKLREPCGQCSHTTGTVKPTNGQDVVRCDWCDAYQYNEPRETVRPINSRPNVKPSQRARIFDRDSSRCALCGTTEGVLHLGHLLSVKVGRNLGATEAELFSDENLAVMCEECNVGYGAKPMNLRLVLRILQARVRWAKESEEGTG